MAKQQVPWSVKGVTPDARRMAKERAQARGITIGEWLSEAINHRASPPEEVASPLEDQAPIASPAETRAREIIEPLEDVLGVMIDRINRLERRS